MNDVTTYKFPGTVVGIRQGERIRVPSPEDIYQTVQGGGPPYWVLIAADAAREEFEVPWGLDIPDMGDRVLVEVSGDA